MSEKDANISADDDKHSVNPSGENISEQCEGVDATPGPEAMTEDACSSPGPPKTDVAMDIDPQSDFTTTEDDVTPKPTETAAGLLPEPEENDEEVPKDVSGTADGNNSSERLDEGSTVASKPEASPAEGELGKDATEEKGEDVSSGDGQSLSEAKQYDEDVENQQKIVVKNDEPVMAGEDSLMATETTPALPDEPCTEDRAESIALDNPEECATPASKDPTPKTANVESRAAPDPHEDSPAPLAHVVLPSTVPEKVLSTESGGAEQLSPINDKSDADTEGMEVADGDGKSNPAAEGTTRPIVEESSACSGASTPAAMDQENSASGGVSATAGDNALPAGNASTSADETSTPAGDSPAPAGDSPAPAGDSPAPADDSPAPAGDSPTSAGDSLTHAGDSPTPAGDSPSPAGSNSALPDEPSTPATNAAESIAINTDTNVVNPSSTPAVKTPSSPAGKPGSTPAGEGGLRSRVTRSRNPDFSAKQRSFMKEYQRSVSRGGTAAVLGTMEGEKRAGSEEPATPPAGKRRRLAETPTAPAAGADSSASFTGSQRLLEDSFCWACHRDGDVLRCAQCPRALHRKCAGVGAAALVDAAWSCVECRRIATADKAERHIPQERLGQLMKYAIGRLKSLPGADPFIRAVDERQFPAYREVVAVPMNLCKMEANLASGRYRSTAAFVADCKWILHNCILFNGTGNKLTTLAKSLLRMCKWEMEEIETCPDCYGNAYTTDNWFIEACPRPHLLVWARLKGFPFWPAKAMKTRDGNVDCRFFGRHDRAWVPAKECFLFSKDPPVPPKGRMKSLDACVEELFGHVKKLEKRFGRYTMAKNRTQYIPERVAAHLKATLPGYKQPPPLPQPQDPVSGKRSSTAHRAYDGKRARVESAAKADTASSAAEKGSVAAEKASAGTEKGQNSAGKGSVPADKVSSAAGKESVGAEKGSVPADKVSSAAGKESVGAEKGAVPVDKGSSAAGKESVAAEKGSVPADKGSSAAGKESVGAEKGSVPADKGSSAAKKASTATEKGASTAGKDSSVAEKPPSESKERPASPRSALEAPTASAAEEPSRSEATGSAAETGKQSATGKLADKSDAVTDERHVKSGKSTEIEKVTDSDQVKDSDTPTVSDKLSDPDKPSSSDKSTDSSKAADREKSKTTSVANSTTEKTTPKPTAEADVTPMHTTRSTSGRKSVSAEHSAPSDNGTDLGKSPRSAKTGDKPKSAKESGNAKKYNGGKSDATEKKEEKAITENGKKTGKTIVADKKVESKTPVVKLVKRQSIETIASIAGSERTATPATPVSSAEARPSWSSRRKTARKSLGTSTIGGATSGPSTRLSDGRTSNLLPTKQLSGAPAEKSAACAPAKTVVTTARRPSSSHTVVVAATTVSTPTPTAAATTIVVTPRAAAARLAASRTAAVAAGATTVPTSNVLVLNRSPADQTVVQTRLTTLTTTRPTGALPVQVQTAQLRPKAWTTTTVRATAAHVSSHSAPVVVTSRRGEPPRLMIPHGGGLYIPAVSQQSTPMMVIPQNGLVTLPVTSGAAAGTVQMETVEPAPVSAEIDRQANSLADLMREGVERYLRERTAAGDPQASAATLQLEMERREWKHKAEISELNRKHESQLAQVRANAEQEQKRAVNRLAMAHAAERADWERVLEQRVAETKRKQWCAECGKEAIFYCCWNTSYCDFPCQEKQWPKHMLTCANQQGGNVDSAGGDVRIG